MGKKIPAALRDLVQWLSEVAQTLRDADAATMDRFVDSMEGLPEEAQEIIFAIADNVGAGENLDRAIGRLMMRDTIATATAAAFLPATRGGLRNVFLWSTCWAHARGELSR